MELSYTGKSKIRKTFNEVAAPALIICVYALAGNCYTPIKTDIATRRSQPGLESTVIQGFTTNDHTVIPAVMVNGDIFPGTNVRIGYSTNDHTVIPAVLIDGNTVVPLIKSKVNSTNSVTGTNITTNEYSASDK